MYAPVIQRIESAVLLEERTNIMIPPDLGPMSLSQDAPTQYSQLHEYDKRNFFEDAGRQAVRAGSFVDIIIT